MRILALDSAVIRCSATVVADDAVVACVERDLDRGHASILPVMVAECLDATKFAAADLDLIGVTIGPGSFTGIRGALALAQGIGAAIGRPVIGVTVGEALAASLPQLWTRTLWCVTVSRRGRIFLETADEVLSLAVNELPDPGRPIAVAGTAAEDIASRLAARDVDVMLTDARHPAGRHIAAVAQRRLVGLVRPLAAEPLYVDPPEARPPAQRSAQRG